MILLLLWEVYRFADIMHKTTEMDKDLARKIERRIQDLEKMNHVRFTECHVYHDANWHESYFPKYRYVDCTMKLLAVKWKIQPFFIYHHNRNLNVICHFKRNDFIAEFGEKNWDSLNVEEQVFVKDGKLIIISY